ncbi:MAG: type II toxin-antitoxin system HicA family toxin [Chitinophagaceae bacterium]|nr:type II toxin-antitoxin system HicA family toxin [Chitinophagaceae bacterium]
MSVKRNQFIKHLEKHNCKLHRHGSKHDVYQNINTQKKTTVPRHPQIDKNLSEAICKQLEIPKF